MISKNRKKDIILFVEKELMISEINQTYENLCVSLKEYLGDKFQKKLEIYIFDRRYETLFSIAVFQSMYKSFFTHSDLYHRTSLSNKSVDRFLKHQENWGWFQLIESGKDKRVKRYTIQHSDATMNKLWMEHETALQLVYKEFLSIADDMPVLPLDNSDYVGVIGDANLGKDSKY